MLESLFNKIAGTQASNFIKKRLQLSCFPVNIAKFLRRPLVAASAFLYPMKHFRTFGFLTCSGDIDMEHWHKIRLTLTDAVWP